MFSGKEIYIRSHSPDSILYKTSRGKDPKAD